MSVAPANPLTQPKSSAGFSSSQSITPLPTDTKRTVGPTAAPMSVAPLMSQETPRTGGLPLAGPAVPPVASSSPVTAVYDRNAANTTKAQVKQQAIQAQPPMAGFASTDPTTQATIAEMQRQAVAQSSQARPAGTPTTTTPSVSPAEASPASDTQPATPAGKEPWGRTGTVNEGGKLVYEEQRWNPQANKYETVKIDAQTGAPLTGPSLKPATTRTTPDTGVVTAPSGGMTDSERFLQQYLEKAAGLGSLTPEEQQSVFAAGEQARLQYQPLIDEARQEKKQGMAKGLIAAGQAGGFMNTQVAGVGALSQTEGGTFVGAGGSLSRLQDSYSAAIGRLESAQQMAINQAMQQRELAIKTGKQENLAAMEKAFQMAQSISQEKRQIAQEGLDRLLKLQQVKKYERETAMETFKALSEAGVDVDDEYFEDLDIAQNAPRGTYRALWDVQQDINAAKSIESAQERQTKALEHADKIIGIADKLGVNVPIMIAGNEYRYQGQDLSGMKSGTEKDSNGRVTYWQINPRTGQTQTVDLGVIGAASGWETKVNSQGQVWRINPNTGENVPYFASEGQAAWSDLYPNGSQSPWRASSDPNQGQCGALCNDLYDPSVGRIIGDSFDQKAQALSQYQVAPDQVRIGDTFLMDIGDTGHVGIVNGVERDPNGKIVIRAFESNMVPPNGRVISQTRPMAIDDPRLKMIARVPLDPQKVPPVGPDAPRAGTTAQPGGVLSGFGSSGQGGQVSFTDKISFQRFVREDPWVKQMPEIQRSYTGMREFYNEAVKRGDKESKNALDQALVTMFNKMLDPGSVVREGEYARTAEGQGLLSRAVGTVERLKQGGAGISDSERADMVEIARTLFDNAYGEYSSAMDTYEAQAREVGLDPEVYLKRVRPTKNAPQISPVLPPPPAGQVAVWDGIFGEYGYVPVGEADNPRYTRL